MNNLCGIYLITHIESGLKYVGQSINIKSRFAAHSRDIRCTRLSAAIKKHGWNSFSAEIIELCDPHQLNELEAKWIAHHNCISPNGLNLTSGGELRIPNDETRQKMALAKKGATMPAKTRAAILSSRLGSKNTTESKQKTSSKLKGRVFSEETRLKMAESARKRYLSGHGQILVQKAAAANRKSTLAKN